MNLNDQQQQARELFFQTNFNQSQIAAEVGVSQKTISLWINSGRWNTLKNMSRTTPAMMIDSMYAELIELNESIHSREPGKRFATRDEADIRRKLLLGIRSIQQQQSAASHMEVLYNFIEFIKSVAPGLTREVTLIADSYLTGEKRLGQRKHFQPYDLPSHEQPIEDAPQETQVQESSTAPIIEEPIQPQSPVPATQPISPTPAPRHPAPAPGAARSPLLHPITPYTAVWPPLKEKPKPGKQIPPHLKGKEREVWINYMQLRNKLLGRDAEEQPDKV